MRNLYLNDNGIIDVSPLSDLVWLGWLDLDNNEIADISPLSGLTILTKLDLANKKLRKCHHCHT